MTDASAAAFVAVNVLGFGGAIALLRMIHARTGEWLNFALVFSVLSGLNLIVGQVALEGRLRPELLTMAVLFGAWWAFLAGALSVLRVRLAQTAPAAPIEKVHGIAMLIVLLVVQLVAFSYEVGTQQLSIANLFGSLWRIGADLRAGDAYATSHFFFSFSIWRWDHVLYIPLAFYLRANRMMSGKVVAAIVAFAALLAFGRYTRAPVIQVAVVSLVSWLCLFRPGVKRKLIAGGVAAAAMTLAFVASQVNLIESDAPSAISPIESVLAYVGGSPLAYQRLLEGSVPFEGGSAYTLEAVNYALYKLGLVNTYVGVSRPFVFAAVTTNVYSFLDVYTIDAGLFGAFLGSLLTGAVVARVFNAVSTRLNYTNLVAYSYLTYCCVMAAANNDFIKAATFIDVGLAWLIGRLIRTRPLQPPRVARLVQQ